MQTTPTSMSYRHLFQGLEIVTPLLDGRQQTYINLDNAASTPPMRAVSESVNRFLDYYSSVHRGTGFKSQLATHAYEAARQKTLEFLGAEAEDHVCIFGKNTTEAINKLARRFPLRGDGDVVLLSGMEHHSNDLPWRKVGRTVYVRLREDGRLDEADYDAKLAEYGRRVRLVAISGASNVTGFLNPIHRLAEKAHAVGAQIAVDCAQLAPHRAIKMGALDDPTHLDYVAISGHKMYAPFGSGALVGRKDTFNEGDPDMSGGGTVEIVTLEEVTWSNPPEKEEAGSPNTVGAIAMATAMRELQTIGMDRVAEHEARLTAQALEGLGGIPGVHIYGDSNPAHAAERLGVIPFKIEGVPHFLAAAILGYEFGIGVRSGCFCAHPYILHLLGISAEEARQVRNRMLRGNRSEMPGLIRISFGLYNTPEEVEAIIEAVKCIAAGKYQGKYTQDIATGEYQPEGWAPDYAQYFSI